MDVQESDLYVYCDTEYVDVSEGYMVDSDGLDTTLNTVEGDRAPKSNTHESINLSMDDAKVTMELVSTGKRVYGTSIGMSTGKSSCTAEKRVIRSNIAANYPAAKKPKLSDHKCLGSPQGADGLQCTSINRCTDDIVGADALLAMTRQ